MDVGSIAGKAIQQAVNQSATQSGAGAAAKSPAEASAEAVARLEDALGAPGQQQPPVGELDVRDATSGVDVAGNAPAASGSSLGDRILGGLGRLGEESRAALDQVKAAVGPKGEVSPADLLRAQSALMQVSIQQDVTSKVAGKATQTLDTLLKNQ
jgi:type III secretion system YscI/HrpB-like protein